MQIAYCRQTPTRSSQEDVQWPTRLANNNTWLQGSIPVTVHRSSLDEQCDPYSSPAEHIKTRIPDVMPKHHPSYGRRLYFDFPASDFFDFYLATLLFLSTTASSHFTYYI